MITVLDCIKDFFSSGISLMVSLIAVCVFIPLGTIRAEDTVIEEWSKVKVPPAPEIKEVSVDVKTTALLILDIEKVTTHDKRPRAVASVPRIAKLLAEARKNGMTVAYSTTTRGTPEDILPEVKPEKGEAVVKSSVDKFYNTDLEKILKDKGIKTVIIVGTAAEGAVMNTSTGAAVRGFEVIVPVDGLSSTEIYAEQYVCWHLMNAPAVRGKVTLTKIGMIKMTEPNGKNK